MMCMDGYPIAYLHCIGGVFLFVMSDECVGGFYFSSLLVDNVGLDEERGRRRAWVLLCFWCIRVGLLEW